LLEYGHQLLLRMLWTWDKYPRSARYLPIED